jgi:hypothetical protein
VTLTVKRTGESMANQRETNDSFEIRDASEIPDVPFVLDLPDGQKLLVGEMAPGTVIEVASWRGTDRPDNRTLRLLLGVSQEDTPDSVEVDAPNYARGRDSIAVRAERAAQRRRRAWIGTLIASLVVIVGAIAFYLSPLDIVHPSQGASVGFGPANSALVITGPPAETYNTGQLIVADAGNNSLAIGRVAAVTGDDLLLQTDTGYLQVVKSKVTGPAVLILPFLGYLFPIISA